MTYIIQKHFKMMYILPNIYFFTGIHSFYKIIIMENNTEKKITFFATKLRSYFLTNVKRHPRESFAFRGNCICSAVSSNTKTTTSKTVLGSTILGLPF